MDIKKWFEDGTGLTIKELRYRKMPPLPYNIFIDDKNYRGSDLEINIIEHNITIEHYSETIDTQGEEIIETFLNNEKSKLHYEYYEKNREWLETEEMWITIYEISTFLEKVRKEGNKNG